MSPKERDDDSFDKSSLLMTLPSMVCCEGCKLLDEELIMLVTGLFDDTVDEIG